MAESYLPREFKPGDLIRFRPWRVFDGDDATDDRYYVANDDGREQKVYRRDLCFVLGFKWRDYPSTPGTCDAVVIVNGRILTVDALMFELVT